MDGPSKSRTIDLAVATVFALIISSMLIIGNVVPGREEIFSWFFR